MKAFFADARTASSQPPPTTPIFYDILQGYKRHFAKFRSRCIPGPHVDKVAKNYCYAMFKIAQL